jgi:hypothetical protein
VQVEEWVCKAKYERGGAYGLYGLRVTASSRQGEKVERNEKRRKGQAREEKSQWKGG